MDYRPITSNFPTYKVEQLNYYIPSGTNRLFIAKLTRLADNRIFYTYGTSGRLENGMPIGAVSSAPTTTTTVSTSIGPDSILQTCTTNLQNANNQISSLQNQLNQTQQQLEAANLARNACLAELEQCRKDSATLREQLQVCQGSLQSCNQQLQALQGQGTADSGTIQTLRDEITRLQAQLAECQRSLQTRGEGDAATQAEIDRLRAEIANCQQALIAARAGSQVTTREIIREVPRRVGLMPFNWQNIKEWWAQHYLKAGFGIAILLLVAILSRRNS